MDIRGWSGGMPRSLGSRPFFRLRPGRLRRWLSRAMPGSARPWCGSTCSRPPAGPPGCCRASRRRRKDRSPSRRLMTCSVTSPGRSFRRFRNRAGKPWRPRFYATRPQAAPSAGPSRAGRAAAGAAGAGTRDPGRPADPVRLCAAYRSPWTMRNGWTGPPPGVLEFCFRRLRTRACLHPADLPHRRCGPARPGPRPAAGSARPCATGPAEPGRYRRDPAVTAGGGAAPVRSHPAV